MKNWRLYSGIGQQTKTLNDQAGEEKGMVGGQNAIFTCKSVYSIGLENG
jgi:hypothetical protein